ncbi:MAG: hypothetical protein IKN50_00980 [Clostridia bacterium]|nr:hypothetical protein [Clostridia bacterium]
MAKMGIFGNLSQTALLVVIRGLGYGLVLASFVAFFVTLTNKKIVKGLLDKGALSRDTAVKAEETGARPGLCRLALREKSALRKTVAATELSDGGSNGTRYYIPGEKADGAEIRYVKRNSPVGWIVGTVLLVAATEGAVRAVPWILSLFN